MCRIWRYKNINTFFSISHGKNSVKGPDQKTQTCVCDLFHLESKQPSDCYVLLGFNQNCLFKVKFCVQVRHSESWKDCRKVFVALRKP